MKGFSRDHVYILNNPSEREITVAKQQSLFVCLFVFLDTSLHLHLT